MDRIEFAIAKRELGIGAVEECRSSNGESLVDVLARFDHCGVVR
jgi:hypothetical protein